MKLTSSLAVIIVLIILVAAGFFYFELAPKVSAPTIATSTPVAALNSVMYSCDQGTLTAIYASSSVQVALSNGQTFSLPQTLSGSGIRYEATSTTGSDIVFWSKGENAFLTENGTNTYDNCVANASAGSNSGMASSTGSASGTSTFTDQGHTFTFNYPSQFTVTGGDGSYSSDWSMVNNSASGILLAKLAIPQSFEPKTNFGDATFTIGTSASPGAVAQCLATPQSGGGPATKSTVTINGITYTKFVTQDAGAGNRYDTTSYRTIRSGQCYAVEYTIHYSVLDNYPAGTVSAFDEAKVQNVLEGIVQSVKFL